MVYNKNTANPNAAAHRFLKPSCFDGGEVLVLDVASTQSLWAA